jgi:hypothetical protein
MKEIRRLPPEFVERIVESITCSLCKTKYTGVFDNLYYEADWSQGDESKIAMTTMLLEEGENSSKNVYREEVSYDICPSCFRNVLMPALAELGAEPLVVKMRDA